MLKRIVDVNQRAARSLERRFPHLFCGADYNHELKQRITRASDFHDLRDILEVGGIDRPLLPRSAKYRYHGLDIEVKERCYEVYDTFVVQSIEKPLSGRFDLIFSTALLEHVRNNTAAFRNIFSALRPGGETHHYLPCKHHPYAVCLRLVGPRLQRVLIKHLRSASVETTGYPAFFDHCSATEMNRLLTAVGFSDIEMTHYFRANDYFAFFLPAYFLVSFFENICATLGWTYFCSGVVVSARKPGGDTAQAESVTARGLQLLSER
jgi:hypothetical protein